MSISNIKYQNSVKALPLSPLTHFYKHYSLYSTVNSTVNWWDIREYSIGITQNKFVVVAYIGIQVWQGTWGNTQGSETTVRLIRTGENASPQRSQHRETTLLKFRGCTNQSQVMSSSYEEVCSLEVANPIWPGTAPVLVISNLTQVSRLSIIVLFLQSSRTSFQPLHSGSSLRV